MKITKHQADAEGLIYIQNCIRLLTMGLQNNVVTLWAATDPLGKQGISLKFHVKSDDDTITLTDCQRYITSFISNEGIGVFHLFGEEPKIALPQNQPPHNPPARDPRGGGIIT